MELHNIYGEYRLWIISIFGGMSVLLLASIWNFYYFKRKKPGEQADFGLIYLCAGLTVWVIASILGLCAARDNMNIDDSVRHSFSMINNGLIACSFPFFEYSVISDNNKKIRAYWPAITLSIAGSVLILIYVFGNNFDHNVGNLLDFLSSSLVLIVLTGILYKTFDNRNLKPLGYFSILVTVAMLLSQFFVTFYNAEFLRSCWFLVNLGFVMGGITFCMFVLLLVALAFTWILNYNNVFDEWKDDDDSIAYWNQYPNDPKGGIDNLLNSIAADGLSRRFFFKILRFFDWFEYQHKYIEEKNNLILDSARYSTVLRDFNNGITSKTKYNIETNKIMKDTISILEKLSKKESSNDTSK